MNPLGRSAAGYTLAALMVLGACSDDDEGPVTSTTSTVADATSSTTAAPTPTESSSDTLADGEHYGFFTLFEPSGGPGGYEVLFDLVIYDPNAEDTHRVVNDNPKVRKVVLAPDVAVSISHLYDRDVPPEDERTDSEAVTLAAFYERNREVIPGDDPTLTPPFIRLTIAGGLVTRIDEIFES